MRRRVNSLPVDGIMLGSILVAADFIPIFQEEYRALRPRAPTAVYRDPLPPLYVSEHNHSSAGRQNLREPLRPDGGCAGEL